MTTLSFYIKFLILTTFYITWIAAFIGYGHTLLKKLKLTDLVDKQVYAMMSYVVGLILASSLASFVNIFISLRGVFASILLGAGVTLFLSQFSFFRSLCSKKNLLILYALIFITGLRTLAEPAGSSFDAGLYHTQQIKWAAESKLVLGLANLHFRFITDSFFLNLAAALEVPFFKHRGFMFISFFYAFAYLWFFAFAAQQVIFKQKILLSSLFLLLTFPLMIRLGKTEIMNPSADGAVASMLLILVYAFIVFCENRHTKQAVFFLCFLMILFAGSFVIKPSAMPFGVFVAITLLLFRNFFKEHRKTVILTCLAALIVISIYSLRTFIKSACLLPVTSFCFFDFADWATPYKQVRAQFVGVKFWSSFPRLGENDFIPDWAIFWPWFGRLIWITFLWPFLSCLVISPVAYILCYKFAKQNYINFKSDFKIIFTVTAVLFMCWFFWLNMHPQFRFVYATHYSMLSIGLSGAMLLLLPLLRYERWPKKFLVPGFLALVISMCYYVLHHGRYTLEAPFFLSEYKSISHRGTTFYLPIPNYGQCWFAPLPCTPDLVPNLAAEQNNDGGITKFYFVK